MEDLDIVNKCICVIAKRGSGKSYLIKYMVNQYKKDFSRVYVICPTEEVNHFYNSITKPEYIFYKWSEEWINTLIKSVSKYKNENQDKTKQILLILDDLIADVRFSESDMLKRLFTRSRHINISVIIAQQSVRSIPLLCRNNCDYIICGQSSQSSIEILADEFRTGDISKKEFIQLYHNNTKNYNFLVINNNSTKDNDLDSLYSTIKCPEKYIN
jgi:hypothetical protein